MTSAWRTISLRPSTSAAPQSWTRMQVSRSSQPAQPHANRVGRARQSTLFSRRACSSRQEHPMNGRDIIKNLHEGRRVYSSAMVSTSPLWPNLVKAAGVDFVFVDIEHTPIDRQTLSWICQTYQALGVPPVVRIPCNDPYEACKALDAGAGGIIGP